MTLKLKAITTATLKVRYQNQLVQFKLEDDPDNQGWRQSPVKWTPAKGSNTALTITWSLDTGATGVSTSSDNITVNGNGTWSVKTTATGNPGDPFTVDVSDGKHEHKKIDPKIVVTPL